MNKVDKGSYISTYHTYKQKELLLDQIEISIQQEMNEIIRSLKTGLKRMEYADKAAIASKKQLDSETISLELGLSNSFRVLQTEEITAQSELTAVSARVSIARIISQYNLAMGKMRQIYGLN
jgi:outer membrane protein TolC